MPSSIVFVRRDYSVCLIFIQSLNQAALQRCQVWPDIIAATFFLSIFHASLKVIHARFDVRASFVRIPYAINVQSW